MSHRPTRTSMCTLAGLSAAAATAGVLSWATVAPGSQIFGPLLAVPHRPDQLALTFDDGPNPSATPHLLDLLALHDIRVTFFLIGHYALQQRALARRIVAEGHMVGNHTMRHPRLPLCTHSRIRAEIGDAQLALQDVTGVTPRLFRPPHGFRTPAVLRSAREHGLETVTWNLIANDWRLPSAEAIAGRVESGILRNQQRGTASNVVLHDGSQSTPAADRLASVAATAYLIERFSAEGVRFVTLDAWLAPPRRLEAPAERR